MPKLEEMSKQGNSPEQIVNLLYNTGYRLTGNHRKAQELLQGVFTALNGNINLNTALKNMCLIYRNKTRSSLVKNLPQDKNSSLIKDNSTNKIQAALLTLPPTERLILVLREILGLNYAEIAELTGMEETAVTRLLRTGRWNLRKYLTPPPCQRKLPEKYTVTK